MAGRVDAFTFDRRHPARRNLMPVLRTRLTVVYTLLSALAGTLILSACDSTKSPPQATTQANTGPAPTTTAPALERFEY
ncbi:MAG TPA: hypothetical protein VEA69_20945, partial [Tepidisphaeraceae bacterium]|nr:hypothetical protein [Tepidisphaeraceae bacterium]